MGGTAGLGARGCVRDRASTWLAIFVLVSTASVGLAATPSGARPCVDPCIEAARGARGACVSSAAGAFTDALDGCLERAVLCLAACRDERQSCRDRTSLAPDLAACEAELVLATERCRNEFRPGSIRRALCVDRARVAGFRCARRAAANARHDLRACRSAFGACAETCGPGSPPGGPQSCRAEARGAFDAARAACRTTFRVTTGACLNRDITCVQDCVAAFDACDAAASGVLDAAIATCSAERDTELAACQAANPEGGPALEACEDTVRATAFACREAALQAAAPGFASCVEAYAGCLRTCPST
jgi:hypothetical protein